MEGVLSLLLVGLIAVGLALVIEGVHRAVDHFFPQHCHECEKDRSR